jgi:hypothetical protein
VTQAIIHDAKHEPGESEHPSGCAAVPELARLRYFHGRALSALDLRREQAFHLEKDRLRNRLLHGWGIVCGLELEVLPPAEPELCDDGPDKLVLRLHPGAAIDCGGNEIVVRRARKITVDSLLGEAELERLRNEPADVYLSLCFHEELIDPSRPLLGGGCEPVPDCEYGRVRETYRICASTIRPDPGPACEPCCGGCGCDGSCIELAAIRCMRPGAEFEPDQLDLSSRRPLAVHDLAEISAINWVHGATYSREGATALFSNGIEVRFSRPVQVASLRPAVVELTVIEAGGGRAAGIYNMQGRFVGLPEDDWLTDRFVFQSTTDETLQYGDRVMISIRGDFIVDECCRAVDGNHLGGAVPTLDTYPAEPVWVPKGPACPPRPSGNGTEGGEFESWVFVQTRHGGDSGDGYDQEKGEAS